MNIYGCRNLVAAVIVRAIDDIDDVRSKKKCSGRITFNSAAEMMQMDPDQARAQLRADGRLA